MAYFGFFKLFASTNNLNETIRFLSTLRFSFNFQAQNKFSIQGNVTAKYEKQIVIGGVPLFKNNKIVAHTFL
jgi:hypothetical protein